MKIRIVKKGEVKATAKVEATKTRTTDEVVKSWIEERHVNRMQEQLEARKFWGLSK
jgi:hypothetical protein